MTRHVELFDRLGGWSYLIVAGNRNYTTRQEFATSDKGFLLLRVPGYESNGPTRVMNWAVYSAKALARGLTKRGKDIVYASTPHLLTALTGYVLARLSGAAFVLEVRDLWPRSMVELGHLREGSTLHRMLSRLEQFLYERADTIVVVTAGWSEHFRSLGIDPGKIHVVSNGADPDDFEPTLTRAEIRGRYGWSEPTAIYAGAHGPTNGLDAVLDAAAKRPAVRFVLIGDGLEKARLQQRARRERLANVQFLDSVPKSVLADVLTGADVGLHVLARAELFKEGMSPNKLYDYLACGLPVVSNAGGEVGRILTEAGAGVSCDWGGIAEGVDDVLGRTEAERFEMAERGRAWVRANRSRSAMAALLERALDEGARGRRG
jgi:glycosyltransferase involved in cell wall biosynthesis